MFMLTAVVLEAISAGSARKFSSGLSFQHKCDHVGWYPTAKQIRVSGIREQGELYGHRYL